MCLVESSTHDLKIFSFKPETFTSEGLMFLDLSLVIEDVTKIQYHKTNVSVNTRYITVRRPPKLNH